ncbi:MAG: NAD-dependent epimerase/dehydratase family protein [Chitinivibrionales bacterium]|nr:NAD-dependent epimerase/dehydratase family protein [Chitinivibrionales bacterium]
MVNFQKNTVVVSVITGVTGFVGGYLAKSLLSHGHTVVGIDQWAQCPWPKVDYSQINILDNASMLHLLDRVRPDYIYHLAAISYLPDADATPGRALEINIMGTVSLLDAVRNSCPSARVLVVGSSKEYGSNAVSDLIAEQTPPAPTDFYGISKFSAEMIGIQYVRQFGLDIRFSRSFNHTGPGQSPRFVCSDWAKQIAEISETKGDSKIKVGDLEVEIDFSDVRDVVEAYYRICTKGKKGETYNVCRGDTVSLDYILTCLLGKTDKKITVEQSKQKLRSHKASPKIAGDNTKLRSHTGWKPGISIEKTLDDLYAYWLKSLKNR